MSPTLVVYINRKGQVEEDLGASVHALRAKIESLVLDDGPIDVGASVRLRQVLDIAVAQLRTSHVFDASLADGSTIRFVGWTVPPYTTREAMGRVTVSS